MLWAADALKFFACLPDGRNAGQAPVSIKVRIAEPAITHRTRFIVGIEFRHSSRTTAFLKLVVTFSKLNLSHQ